MSTVAAKKLVRRCYSEAVRDLSLVEECIGSSYVDHNNELGGRGPEVFSAHIEALRRTFPDFSVTIEDMFADGDTVVTRVTVRGTHAGTWMQIEPTGAVVKLKGINIDRVADGRIVEHWGEADTVGMLLQMGVDPFAGRRAEERDRICVRRSMIRPWSILRDGRYAASSRMRLRDARRSALRCSA